MALVILGLGNDLLGDDGAGLLAAERLEGRFGSNVEIRRTAQSGLYLLEHLQGFDDAIVIDTVLGDRPGRVRELHPGDVPAIGVPSAHYVGLPEALAVARHAGLRVPSRLRIFAVEMDAAQTIGAGVGAKVSEAIPELVARAEEAARAWGYAPRPRRELVHA